MELTWWCRKWRNCLRIWRSRRGWSACRWAAGAAGGAATLCVTRTWDTEYQGLRPLVLLGWSTYRRAAGAAGGAAAPCETWTWDTESGVKTSRATRMVSVSLGSRCSWGCRSSVCDTNLGNRLSGVKTTYYATGCHGQLCLRHEPGTRK